MTGNRILMRYVLLLRGVNVGGRNKVDMPELKRKLERIGFPEAAAYLNSGNILLLLRIASMH